MLDINKIKSIINRSIIKSKKKKGKNERIVSIH